MPYTVARPIRRDVSLAAACLALVLAAVGFAAPAARADSSSCTAPALSQPFLGWGDSNQYALVPGESADNFDGTGWTLLRGAQIVTTTLADGSTGQVLDLPSGSVAVSPPVCLASNYPTARTMIQNVGNGGGGVAVVSRDLDSRAIEPLQTLNAGSSWSLSQPFNTLSENFEGWNQFQFAFIAYGQAAEYQLYNFYVDPYSR